jgi:integrase
MYLKHKEQMMLARMNKMGKGIRAKTLQEYERKVEVYLIPALGHYRLDAIRPIDIQTWFDKALVSGGVKGKGLSAQTLKHVLIHLKAGFEYLVDLEIIPKNPCRKIRLPAPNVYKGEILAEEEVATVITAVQGSKYYMPVVLAIALGTRRSEILALTWDDVDVARKTVRVNKSLSHTKRYGLMVEEPKTEGSGRTIAIGDTLIATLCQHKSNQDAARQLLGEIWQDLNLVCTDDDGGYLNPDCLSRAWADIRERAGISKRIRLHDCRDLNNTLLRDNGVPETIRMARGGWATAEVMNKFYTHTNPEQQREAAALMDDLLRSALPGNHQD